MRRWFATGTQDALDSLGTNRESGLETKEAADRLRQHGPNALKEEGGKSAFQILISQLAEVMVLILVVAAGVSFFLHEVIDGIVILVIVVLNTILGFWQEFRAEKAMAALKKLAVPVVRVRRDGAEQEIRAKELVPGDIMLFEAGNIIPADGRILQSANLRVQEATLTGESRAVDKQGEVLPDSDLALADRKNMVYMGTVVSYGRGEALVTGTGMDTELGKIATMLQQVEDERTPLQKRLSRLGKVLAVAALVLIGVVAAISLARGVEPKETFMTAISMAVAAIPEGLPAVVTIALALGAQKMFRKKSLIRHLPAVETLGSVTVICSDKTGTLTQNRMTVITLVDGQGSHDMKDVLRDPAAAGGGLPLLLAGGALCTDAVLQQGEGEKKAIGDPTEGALVIAAAGAGLEKPVLQQALPRVSELPFDSERKRMTTVHALQDTGPGLGSTLQHLLSGLGSGTRIAFTKGAVDSLLQVCTQVYRKGKVHPLDDNTRQQLLEENAAMASNAVRVLGLALRLGGDELEDANQMEQDLIFVGMFGMVDPVRPEVKDAVATCIKAGIRPVMITGDHPLTALSIARELGITAQDRCVTGQELATMDVAALKEISRKVSVYARVSPEHKMKLVDALQAGNQIVAMTGDGVNDAPALKSADIGVAMGITGTDVSKESSDMVLLDDNFATIVSAVREGRTIYDNIRKFVKYILTGNAGEIFVMLVGPFLGMPLPLLPIQILWINLVTDGAPGVALGYEPPEEEIMERPPYAPGESVFARGVGRQILWVGALVGLLSLAVGYWFFTREGAQGAWQTMVFTTLTFCQMMFAYSARSERHSVFRIRPWSNPTLLFAILGTFLLQLGIIYLPFFQRIFRTVALSWQQLGICFAAGLVVILAQEVGKAWLRSRSPVSARSEGQERAGTTAL